MNLREQLGLDVATGVLPDALYRRFGVTSNPFPVSGQTSKHPRLPVTEDETVIERMKSFFTNGTSQVMVVTANQGVGKTNLLEHYQRSLPEALGPASGYYVIKYLTDPEPTFKGVIRTILQDLGIEHLRTTIEEISRLDANKRASVLSQISTAELKGAFQKLITNHGSMDAGNPTPLNLFHEYIIGLRVYVRHRDALGVNFTLQTQEQMTQALRDIVTISREVGTLKGILLFMDELEKVGQLTPRQMLGYLSATRALIDALPNALFMVLAMTDAARAQYVRQFPSLAGRFGEPVTLEPLRTEDAAVRLATFYIENKRTESKIEMTSSAIAQGAADVVTVQQMRQSYQDLSEQATRGRGFVTQRQYLDTLHQLAERAFVSQS